jgi:hypothetical protein
VVAVHQEDRGRTAGQSQEPALVGVELPDRVRVHHVAVVEAIDAEVIAQRDIEVGPVPAHILHGADVKAGIEHPVQAFRVRVPLHTKGERTAGWALRVETILGSGRVRRIRRFPVTQPVVIARVGRQLVQQDLEWLGRL